MLFDGVYAYTGGRSFSGERTCVVLIHGAQHDHSVWALQSRALAHHGFDVLAVDLPGHGRSSAALQPSVEAMAARLARALAPLASTQFVLAGHSLGSLIALELALCLGARAAGVALVSCAFPMKVAEPLLAATRDDPARAMQMINVWSHSAGLAPYGARPGCPGPGFNIVWQNLRLMQRIAQLNGAEVLSTDFAACNAYANGIEAMRQLQCPALFVLSAEDQMTPPRAAQSLIDACVDPTVVCLPRGGHAAMAENPDAVREALMTFAARRSVSPAQRPRDASQPAPAGPAQVGPDQLQQRR